MPPDEKSFCDQEGAEKFQTASQLLFLFVSQDDDSEQDSAAVKKQLKVIVARFKRPEEKLRELQPEFPVLQRSRQPYYFTIQAMIPQFLTTSGHTARICGFISRFSKLLDTLFSAKQPNILIISNIIRKN